MTVRLIWAPLGRKRPAARFVGSRDPAHIEWCGHIRAIPTRKAMPQPVGWLTKAEIDAMLKVPD